MLEMKVDVKSYGKTEIQKIERKETNTNRNKNPRVPVVGKDGKPRMPTKASRARRWIKLGKAIPKWSKLGIFYVQLTVDAGDKVQDVVLGLDPGSKFDGVAVVSEKEVYKQECLNYQKE